MNHHEQQKTTPRQQQEQDPQRFEKIAREVRAEQSPSTGEEGSEEERRQWQKSRDISKEKWTQSLSKPMTNTDKSERTT